MSPAGSEQFTFKRHPDVRRTCYFCGKPLKRDDVADVREYPVAYFCCRECFPSGSKADAA